MSGSAGSKSTNADPYVWIGPANASWGTPANWQDSANPQNSGLSVPGPLTPVSITNQSGAGYKAITTGGTAASLGVTGNIDLLGSYAIGSITAVGSLAATSLVPTAGSLVLSSSTTLTTGGLNVLDGVLALASGAAVLSSAPVIVGFAGGFSTPNQSGFAYTPGAAGNILLSPGATIATTGSMALASGVVSDIGGTISVGGSLTVGTPGTVFAQTPLHTINTATGRVVVSGGGTMTVAGDIAATQGALVVTGAGSTLSTGGTLSTGVGGNYSYTANGVLDSFNGSLLALNGGSVQAGSLILNTQTPTPFADTVVYVDAASSIEIGNTGGARTGAITIDAGRTVTARANGGLYGFLVDNGALIVSAGTLVQSGDVSGTGTIGIARGGTWLLSGSIGNTNTISFLGTGAELAIGGAFAVTGTSVASSPNTVGAVVQGFQVGDAIGISDPVNAATYTAGVNGSPGTLTLANNGTTVESLRLLGSYNASSFIISPVSGGGAVISLTPPATVTPTATNNDTFSWSGSGSWGTASNWRDTTTNATASVIPGASTSVTIAGSTTGATAAIVGGGTASSISQTGSMDLVGRYTIGTQVTVGTVTVGTTTATLLPGSLHLLSGGTMAADTVTIVAGDMSLLPGTSLSAGTSINLGVAPGRNIATNNGYVSTLGATGTLCVGTGSTLAVASNVTINQGTLSNADGLISIGGSLVIGTAPTGAPTGALYTAAANGSVSITTGGSLSVAGPISDPKGILVVDGIGAALTSTGTLTAAGSGVFTDVSTFSTATVSSSLAALNGGLARIGGAVVGGDPAAGLHVDTNSIIEVGTIGGAAVGAITVDAGYRITAAAGTLSGNLVNNGTVLINGGALTEIGNVAGTGTVQIGSNATFALNGSVGARETIAFLGTGGTLSVGTRSSMPVSATLTGFTTGDALVVPQPITAATYNAGLLALINQGTTVATVTLSGSYSGRTFITTPTATGTSITLADNAAALGMEDLGLGSLSQTANGWTLDLGTVVQGATPMSEVVGFLNAATASVGVLGGTFNASNTNGFTNSGFTSGLSGLAAGQEEHGQTISLATTAAGSFSETITLNPTTTNGSGTASLPQKTVVVTGTILPAGSTYTLSGGPTTISAGAGNDVFNATAAGFNSRTALNGGAGANVLNLNGGGVFDLGAPSLLANIPTINLTKSSNPSTVFLRDAAAETVNVGGTGSAIIYGGSGTDTINLTSGSDTVVLGSAAESVRAGIGTTLIQASMASASARIVGSPVGATTLEITSGGTGSLSPLDTNLVVTLDRAAHLSLGPARFVTAIGSAGSDTIVAGTSGQTLTGGGSGDLLIGSSAFGDTFADTSSGISGDTISNFGGSDLIDVTDLNFASLASPTVTSNGGTTTVALSNSVSITVLGTFLRANFQLGSDGHGGTQISYLPS
jgi:fibronectin-binding autotransporter adhesin